MQRQRKARRPECWLDLRVEAEVRRMPAGFRWRALAWLRRWRRRPERVFWEITPTGEWRLL